MAVYGEQSSPAVSYSTWDHDEQVKFKISSFDPQNPLGISTCMNWIILLYVPVLVVAVTVINLFSIWVLRSSHLRRSFIKPLIIVLLYVHIILIIVGPLYVWLVQVFRIHFTRNQIYSCFFLLLGHDFAMLASPHVLFAMVYERALAIEMPEIFSKGCRNTVALMLVVSLLITIGRIMWIDVTSELQSEAYPICMPWWSTDHGSVIYSTLAQSQRQYVDIHINISHPRSFWEHSYLLVSRSDAEALLWLWYYSYPLFVVPILFATEVFFRRKWHRKLLKVARCFNCRRKRNHPRMRFGTDDLKGRGFKGHITKIDIRIKKKKGTISQKKLKNIKVYDAEKAIRVGRNVEGSRVDSRKCRRALTGSLVLNIGAIENESSEKRHREVWSNV